ncbi:MucBP domain-containing protein [Lactococcus petauri]|uniref:MucBP domain-containing protein n=1 Tax=Lactococcus petauri TaxID=1940789 RepID=UPI00254CA407|nr:MucBP domain-containing protein [Lactococcus petauri]
MKKIFFSYIALVSLILPSIFIPSANVHAAEQKESVEQTTSEESVNMNNSNTTLGSSTTSDAFSESSAEGSNESKEETTTESSSNSADNYGEHLENTQDEMTGQTSTKQSEVATDNDQEDLAAWLPDPTLQSVVAKSLGIDVSEITKEKMRKLQTLYIYASDSTIADLTGLEYATNLSSFYMSGQNQVTDFSVLTSLNNLVYVYLMGANVMDDNVPNFGDNVTRLDLSSASVTDAVFSKIVNMKGLESLSFESNMNITTIAPLVALPNLKELRIQTCGVTDFTVINQFPKLSILAAYGQNTGRNDGVTSLSAKELNYDPDNQSFFVPFSIMPNRLTNFDGYQPSFTVSNSASQMYFDLNGVQIPSSRLTITEEGITVSEITQSEFESIETMEYNAFYNNPAGSYAEPDGYSFYAISSGTYLHQFSINHQEVAADVTVSYIDTEGKQLQPSQKINGNIGESFDATTPNYKLEIDGYILKEVQGTPTGQFTDRVQTVTYVYTKKPVKAADVTAHYVDTKGNKISDDVVKSGNIGDDYSTEQKDIEDYAFKEVQGNPTGQFTDETQTVTYVYTKNKVNPVKPIPNDNNPSHKEDTSKSESSSTHDALPETGENVRMTLISVGTGLIFLMVVLIASVFRFKRFKNNK